MSFWNGHHENKSTQMTTASFQRWRPWTGTLNPKPWHRWLALRFPHRWLKLSGSKVCWKSSARKVTYPNTILVLSSIVTPSLSIRWRDESEVPTGENYGVASSLSWSQPIWNLGMDITRITQRLLPPFEGEHLERARTSQPAPITPKDKPLDFHMVGIWIPHYNWVDHRW
jgi:hypothetical protein